MGTGLWWAARFAFRVNLKDFSLVFSTVMYRIQFFKKIEMMFFLKASTDEQVHCKWFITCWTVTGLPHTGTPCLPGILVPGKVRKHTNKGCPHKECDVLLTQVISASQVFITAMLHGRKRREKTVFRLRGWIVFFPPKWKILKKFSSHEKKRKKETAEP